MIGSLLKKLQTRTWSQIGVASTSKPNPAKLKVKDISKIKDQYIFYVLRVRDVLAHCYQLILQENALHKQSKLLTEERYTVRLQGYSTKQRQHLIQINLPLLSSYQPWLRLELPQNPNYTEIEISQ